MIIINSQILISLPNVFYNIYDLFRNTSAGKRPALVLILKSRKKHFYLSLFLFDFLVFIIMIVKLFPIVINRENLDNGALSVHALTLANFKNSVDKTLLPSNSQLCGRSNKDSYETLSMKNGEFWGPEVYRIEGFIEFTR